MILYAHLLPFLLIKQNRTYTYYSSTTPSLFILCGHLFPPLLALPGKRRLIISHTIVDRVGLTPPPSSRSSCCWFGLDRHHNRFLHFNIDYLRSTVRRRHFHFGNTFVVIYYSFLLLLRRKGGEGVWRSGAFINPTAHRTF